MIAPALPPFDTPDLGGRIPEVVAEQIARLLLAVADAELQAERAEAEDGGPAP